MFPLIKENKYFFIPFGLFLLVGGGFLAMIETGDFLFFCSENRTDASNVFFRYYTKIAEEPIYIVAIIAFLFVRLRLSLLVLLLGLLVTLVSFGSKQYFGHLRPKSYLEQQKKLDELNQVPGVKMHIGPSSFPSGHTMSGFAIFTFFALLLPRRKYLGFLFASLAILTGISRVYLCQHFLKDIYLGAIMGTLLAILLFYLHQNIPASPHAFLDKNLQCFFKTNDKRHRP